MELTIIIELIGLSCITNLITFMGYPIQVIKKYLGLEETKILNCSKCLGFWIGTIYYVIQFSSPYGILYGAIVSLLSESICRYFNH